MPDKTEQSRTVIEALGVPLCERCHKPIRVVWAIRSSTGWCWVCVEEDFDTYTRLDGAATEKHRPQMHVNAQAERAARQHYRR